MKEIWKPIPGYDGYEVSNCGRVQSLPRSVVMIGNGFYRPWIRKYPGRIRKLVYLSQGRIGVKLTHAAPSIAVSILVARAFLGEPPSQDRRYVVHNDGNPKNNHVSNLRYDTQKNNMADRIRHGTSNRGNRNGMAKLAAGDVKKIKNGGNAIALAKKYGISLGSVYKIWNGQTWGWIDADT